MITAVKRLIEYMQTDRKTYDNRPWEKLTFRFFVDRFGLMLPIAAAQAVLLVYYWMVIGPQYYFYFYLLPLATFYPYILPAFGLRALVRSGLRCRIERPLVIT